MRIWIAAGCVALLAACTQQPAAPTEVEQIAHGNYLVNNIGGCNDCHTPMLPSGEPDRAHALQGAPLAFELVPPLQGHVPWTAVAPPIAGGPAGYSDEQFVHFLQTGERPDGSHPNAPMPPFRFNEADAHAVAAYIKSVPRAEH